MSRILVTGAAGFVGSHTVEALLAAGHQVTGVDNLRTGRMENLAAVSGHPGWRFIQQDMLETEAFCGTACAALPEVILHLAALVSVQESIERPALNFELNVRCVHNVIEAVRRAGVRRLVFASSAAVYGEPERLPLDEQAAVRPLSPYGAAKLAGEDLILSAARGSGFEAVCLRYFNIYGPRQCGQSPYSSVVSRFLQALRDGCAPVIYGDGRQTRDFVHVRDVARANLLATRAMAPLTAVFNICTGREVTLNQLAAILSGSFPAAQAPKFAAARSSDIHRSVGDPNRAKETLGFAAGTALNSGLGEIAHAIDESGLSTQSSTRVDPRHPKTLVRENAGAENRVPMRSELRKNSDT